MLYCRDGTHWKVSIACFLPHRRNIIMSKKFYFYFIHPQNIVPKLRVFSNMILGNLDAFLNALVLTEELFEADVISSFLFE